MAQRCARRAHSCGYWREVRRTIVS